MRERKTERSGGRWPAFVAAVAMAASGCAGTPRPAGEAERLEALRREGREASLTILPVAVCGVPMEPVGEALGLLLERAGMPNLEVGTIPFRGAAEGDPAATAAALRAFVGANPIPGGHALFAEFRGSPGKGFEEIRAVIVDRGGERVFEDRCTTRDPAFARMRPAEPMQCALLLVDRLRPLLSLGDPARGDAPEGRLAKRWSERTGLPSDAERKAMASRAEAFRKAAAGSRLLVLPVRVNDGANALDGRSLADSISGAGLAQAAPASEPARLEVPAGMNEQKALWDLAREFRRHLRSSPPDADYAMQAHYLLGKGGVGAVHFVVCDRAGEWVLVDFQNDHQPDFRAIAPRNAEDCGRLVVRRLERTLRGPG